MHLKSTTAALQILNRDILMSPEHRDVRGDLGNSPAIACMDVGKGREQERKLYQDSRLAFVYFGQGWPYFARAHGCAKRFRHISAHPELIRGSLKITTTGNSCRYL